MVIVQVDMAKSAASTSNNAAVASARACLDVMRGAAVLIEHNKVALVELLTGGAEDGVGATGEQELTLLHGLGRHIFDVIELCTPKLEPTSGRPAGLQQSPGAVAGVLGSPEVTEVPTKNHREQDMEGGQQLPHYRQHAAAATVGQSSTSATVTATALATGELLRIIMEYVGGGSGRVWDRREELGRMALVCRAWRDAAHREVLGPLAKELIPRLANEYLSVTQDELKMGAAGSYRHYLVRCGQLTSERRLLDDHGWADDLMLQCEVWDVDGFCMFSTRDWRRSIMVMSMISAPWDGVQSSQCEADPR